MKKNYSLELISKILHEENFFYSEAYPISRWKRNKWPKLSIEGYEIIDIYLKLYRKLDNYEKK